MRLNAFKPGAEMGDRFFDYKRKLQRPDYVFCVGEFLKTFCRKLGVNGKSPDVTRRNVITAGVDLNSLVGKKFEIQGVWL